LAYVRMGVYVKIFMEITGASASQNTRVITVTSATSLVPQVHVRMVAPVLSHQVTHTNVDV